MSVETTYNCGQIFPSGCIVFTGTLPNFITTESVSCPPSIDEILGKYGDALDTILDSIDLTGLDKGCFDFDPDTIQVKELEQLQIDKICEHETEITALQTELTNLDISTKSITINLDCLGEDATACADESEAYTLLSILILFRNAICDLRTQVDECCTEGVRSGTSGTSGVTGTSGTSGTSAANGGTGTSGTSGTSGTVGLA